MKIKIYYSDVIPAPVFEERDGKMVANDVDETLLEYRFAWSGSDRDLDFEYTLDEKTLESVFDYFNRDEAGDFAGDFRSLSMGDVVCLEDRCYLCQTVGWRSLENFEAKNLKTNE